MNMQLRTVIILLFVLMTIGSQAEIYRWVDDKGQVHFGDKPGSTDHEVIQPEKDENSSRTEPSGPGQEVTRPENMPTNETTENNQTDDSAIVEAKPVENEDEKLKQKEAERLKKIQKMEALAEELRIEREKREKRRSRPIPQLL